MLLVLLNVAVSNLVLFRNNFALSRDLAGECREGVLKNNLRTITRHTRSLYELPVLDHFDQSRSKSDTVPQHPVHYYQGCD